MHGDLAMNRKQLINLFLNNPGKCFNTKSIMQLTRLYTTEAVRQQVLRLRAEGLPIKRTSQGYQYTVYAN